MVLTQRHDLEVCQVEVLEDFVLDELEDLSFELLFCDGELGLVILAAILWH